MKTLLENWRKFRLSTERVNCLEPDSGKRFIRGALVEIKDNDHTIPISPEELEEIKEWGGLSGEPSFLGTGTKGSAYRFGDRVLKITSDSNEAKAAKRIVGKSHPNVYDIYGVARRSADNLRKSTGGFEHRPYIVIYEFLDYPTQGMLEPTRHLHDMVRAKGQRSPFYSWNESNLEEARILLKRLAMKSRTHPEVLGEPMSRWGNVASKATEISENMRWTPEETMKFVAFFAGGLDSLNPGDISPEGLLNYYKEQRNNLSHKYLHQLATGLTFLRENGIIFDDLKASNIMEKGNQIAIIDIGYSSVEGEDQIPLL